MRTTKQKASPEFLAELADLSLRRVRRIVNGKPVMVTLISQPDELPHQPTNKGDKA
ncbi:hypothetical protein [Aeromonas sp.]|uniref:hypothetical protein n=1 Tax=Aeromonas sp. TaxID=647 RepID=UPI00258D1C05|nr:hypothetical protein [Aeromonas sp.]MCX7132421.1 hypothetical protein [Aeromonas sp.]